MERRTKFVLGCLGVFAAALVMGGGCGVWLLQYVRYGNEHNLIERRNVEAKKRFADAYSTAWRLPDFKDEWVLKERHHEETLAAVPRSLDVPAFMNDLAEWAKHSNVAIVSQRVEEKRRDIYEEAEITLELRGTKDDLQDLSRRRHELSRLTRWSDGAVHKVSIFAMSESEHNLARTPPGSTRTPSSAHPCRNGFASRVWLPPYAKRLALAYAKLRATCDELSRLEALDAQIAEYRNMVADIERRSRVIAELRRPDIFR